MITEFPEIPHFDPAAIDRLRQVAGDQAATFVAEMARLFLAETAKSLADLAGAAEKGEWRQVGRIAHSLKSSAATLGLMRLSALSKALETDAGGGVPTPQTAPLITALLDEFERARPTLRGLA
jgi:HPt (histidine-containing phosphotransfer) domain-containing protein